MSTHIYGQRSHHDLIELLSQKSLKFWDSGTAHATILRGASSISADVTFTLPAADGTSGQAMVTNASGVLSFASFLTATLAQHDIHVGNASNVATAVDTSGTGDILADSTNGLTIKAGVIVNSEVSNTAAIAYSKLNLSASIVNADVAAGAAIAYSKLNLSASIVNADVATSAAIALSKLAALTASRALQSDGSGVISVSAVTTTELGYVSGVTSAIQTQLNGKSFGAATNWVTADTATKTFTHNLGSTDVLVQIHDKTDGSLIEVDSVIATDANTTTLTASSAPPAAGWRVIAIRV